MGQETKMNNIAGPPVEGDDFFGREQAVAALRDLLEHHDVLLLGPRRIGKTSAARRILAKIRAEGWRAIEVNVAACKDERGLIDKLRAALVAELTPVAGKVGAMAHKFRSAIGTIKSIKYSAEGAGTVEATLRNASEEDWTRATGDVAGLIGQSQTPLLIYMDELPILLFNIITTDPHNGVQRVRRFLDWFRNDLRNLPGGGKARWLITGSVGLDTLVQQHGMADAVNSLKHQTLEPFTAPEAVALLNKLAASYAISLTEEESQAIVAALRWPQPYYLQLFFNELRAMAQRKAATRPGEHIEQVLEQMITSSADNDFHHWEERLTIQLCPADAQHALALLGRTAHDPQGVRAETLLAEQHERLPHADADEARRTFIRLRDVLIRDAYWLADESSGVKRYCFRLEPLRRWWARRDTL